MNGSDRTPVLIGVGGTGQTVLASYLRLANMAGFDPARFFVVDSDTRGQLGGTVTKLRGEVKQVAGGGKLPSRWMIDPFPKSDAERRTFGSLFGNLVGERRRLFNCLFSEEAEQTSIRSGMYGRPSIGATCIRYKILQGDDDLKELKDTLRGGAKHVILVGSCFGGTGSGGVPMLASEFARLNEEPGYDLQVDAMIFLPWFRLVLGDGDLRTKDRTLHEHLNANFEPNAAAGIHYFKKELREHVESLILLGMPDPAKTTRVSDEANQGETVHPLNLLAAVLVQNRFAGDLEVPRGLAGYWFDSTEGLEPRSISVSRNGQGSLSLLQVTHRASLGKDWLGILSKFFQNFQRLPGSHQPLFLRTALEQVGGATRDPGEIAREVGESLGRRKDLANDGLTWIKQMAEEDPQLFPLAEESLEIRSERYEEVTEDPLVEITTWSRSPETVSKFQAEHLRSSEALANRVSELFLNHLIAKFEL